MPTQNTIKCLNCQNEIYIDEIFYHQIEERLHDEIISIDREKGKEGLSIKEL